MLFRVAIAVLMGLLLRSSVRAADRPDVLALFAKVIQRARENATNSSAYLFDKRSTIDTFNGEGELTKRKVKLFLVTMTGGVPEERLVALEGKQLSDEELAREEKKSKGWSRRLAKKKDDSKKRSFVPEDVTNKFTLSYLRQEQVQGRKTHVLSFKPNASAPSPTSFSERILRQLSGTLWIDAGDSEVVRVEVKLGKKVSLWGGFLGSLNQFELKLKRARSSAGVWYNQIADIHLDARGFLKRLRMKIHEQSSNFRPASK